MADRSHALCALLGATLLAAPSVALGQAADATGNPPEKMICKKVAETGSLVRRTKVCLTRDQWNRSASRGQEYSRDLQENLRTRPAGGT
jgi:hypothetical protein